MNPKDYDLVIWGAAPAVQAAALRGVRWGARVAWADGASWENDRPHSNFERSLEGNLHGGLEENLNAGLGDGYDPDRPDPHPPNAQPSVSFPLDRPWGVWPPRSPYPGETVGSWLQQIQSLHQRWNPQDIAQELALGGVDRLSPATGLWGRSRRYLVITQGLPGDPPPLALQALPWFTPWDLVHGASGSEGDRRDPSRDYTPDPATINHWLVWGASPESIAWAGAWRSLGCQVTLVYPRSRLLPAEDPDLSQALTHHLEAQGIAVWPSSADGLTPPIPPNPGPQALFWVDRPPDPALSWLRSHGVSLPLQVSPYGQVSLGTAHPQIYACGGALGGYDLPSVTAQEAAIAVDRALGLRPRPLTYAHLPYTLPLTPPLVRVGLTEPQARHGYPPAIALLLSPQDPLTGHSQTLKLIVTPRGKILGFHGLGSQTPQLLGLMAAAIAHGTPLPALLRQAGDPWSFALLHQWDHHLRQHRWQRHPLQAQTLRWFFNWQRTGHV